MKTVKNIALSVIVIWFCGAFGATAQAADAPDSATSQKASATKKVQLQTSSLGTVTVTGSQLHALWEIKKALNRIHSFHNPNQLVCTVKPMTGSHINRRLLCETNRHWWERLEHVRLGLLTGNIHANKSYFMTGINYVRFRQLMRSLPPEDGE